jgi:superfamily I DNA/RNA helicase
MIESLRDAVVNYETVEELILASTFLERDSGEGVNLLTAHGSKGLEFDRVFVVGVEEGLWPHKNSLDIDEEGRLFFVALSRARRSLNLSYCKNRMYRGTMIPTFPSPLFKQAYLHITEKDLF